MMKKLTLLAIAGLLAFSAQAQTTKGTLVLTGKLGYSQSKSKHDRDRNTPRSEFEQYNYTVSPSIGFLIKDNLEIGVRAHRYKLHHGDANYFENVKSNWENGENNKGVSVYARQYKYLTEKLALHGTLSSGISNQVITYASNTDGPYPYTSREERDAILVNGSLSPGITFFVSKKLGIQAGLGALTFNHSVTDSFREYTLYNTPPYELQRREDTIKRNVLQFDFSSMHLNFGLSYFIGQ
ncbi:hypothetical protein [Pontibacter amylolyticus]|uniref:Outer membrane protein beta-barrel domain-containing protein n=1 Tax=Pontibacter amylolyticus TaxID=1424080 RepID=A0ABQ1W3S8_9BACT|nr:hypothetical protein [Pontibacter amylolyticus]GGG13336.1 hypothetical protein GCM10011323_17140 [Pontibacter amylolyticus]